MAKKGQKFKKYDKELKEKIVKEHFKTGIGYLGLSKKYNINGKTIESWIRSYKTHGGLSVAKRGRPKGKIEEQIDYKERYEILKKFQEFLKEVDREKK